MTYAPGTRLDRMNLADYAEEVLTAYNSPIASDHINTLLYMTVGAGRLHVLNGLTNRMRKLLKVGGSVTGPGIFFELILGEFGSGKSHIGYMFKHNAMTCGEEVLVAHVQITGEARFPATLASLLRSLRLSGHPSVEVSEVELSAYRRVFDWCGRDRSKVEELVAQSLGNLNPAVGQDFAHAIVEAGKAEPNAAAMQQFLEAWINRSEPKAALQVFEMVLRLFRKLKSSRCVLIIDEFEAIQAMEPQGRVQALQAFQDLYDDFTGRKPGLPLTHLVCFTTRDWWETSSHILPSLMGEGQRVRKVTELPEFDEADIAALFYRYISLYQLARQTGLSPSRESVDRACTEVLASVSGTKYLMRSIHARVREKVEELLDL